MQLYLVGTDTAVGKTAVACALLRAAARAGLRVTPFKPVQSGDDEPSDAARLTAAAGLHADAQAQVCPTRFAAPLAPGIAQNPAPFLVPAPADPAPRHRAVAHLRRWQAAHGGDFTLIEGVGGLHVPMPGATWQGSWIVALATHTLVVARAGLGTINHTLLTIAGLRELGRPPLGFVFSAAAPPDPSVPTNAAVIAARTGVAHLGTIGPDPARHLDDAAPILAALRRHL